MTCRMSDFKAFIRYPRGDDVKMLRKENMVLRERVRNFVKKQKQPFSVNDVAREFRISWTTARAILLELALKEEVEIIKTTKSYIFIPKEVSKYEN